MKSQKITLTLTLNEAHWLSYAMLSAATEFERQGSNGMMRWSLAMSNGLEARILEKQVQKTIEEGK